MTGADLKRWRTKQKMSQGDLGKLLAAALDRPSYAEGQPLSSWETGKRPIPAHVKAFLTSLMADSGFMTSAPDDAPAPSPGDGAPRAEDTPPNNDPDAPAGTLFTSSGVYAKVCEEMFEMVAMGVGLVGMGLGSQALIADAQVIDADKQALGKAYGKLAETNETFRKMIQSATTGGAWVEVAFVTGQTAAKLWHNHAQARPAPAMTDLPDAPPSSNGGGNVDLPVAPA